MDPQAILLAARSQEGLREDPIGSNWGPPGHMIRVMLALVGMPALSAWKSSNNGSRTSSMPLANRCAAGAEGRR